MNLRLDRDKGVPLGAQLEARLRTAIETGALAAGDRLPSLRHVAAEAGVNVNTVRAVYARLEAGGAITTEQGRGTFAAAAPPVARRALREQIARLEAELVRLPSPRPATELAASPRTPGLLSTEELAAIRDDLMARLQQLDAARADVIQRLARLDTAAEADLRSAGTGAHTVAEPALSPPRRSNATLSGARVRWVGA
jgi:DNA-binding transcriptional regulator YhcF (GntR family)